MEAIKQRVLILLFALTMSTASADKAIINRDSKIYSGGKSIGSIEKGVIVETTPRWKGTKSRLIEITAWVPARSVSILTSAPPNMGKGTQPPLVKADELGGKCYDLEGQIIKLMFRRRGEIEQVSPDRYTTKLYGDSYRGVEVQFGREGLKVMEKLPTRLFRSYYPRSKSGRRYVYGQVEVIRVSTSRDVRTVKVVLVGNKIQVGVGGDVWRIHW